MIMNAGKLVSLSDGYVICLEIVVEYVKLFSKWIEPIFKSIMLILKLGRVHSYLKQLFYNGL